MFNFIRMFVFLALVIAGACGLLALFGEGAGQMIGGLDKLAADHGYWTDMSAVGTRSDAPAEVATPTKAVEPTLEATQIAPQAPNGDWIISPEGVVIKATAATKFYLVAEEGKPVSQVSKDTWLKLEFELEGHPGWYGVEYSGQKGFVKMYEFPLPEGIYTQENLRDLIPWGAWPQ